MQIDNGEKQVITLAEIVYSVVVLATSPADAIDQAMIDRAPNLYEDRKVTFVSAVPAPGLRPALVQYLYESEAQVGNRFLNDEEEAEHYQAYMVTLKIQETGTFCRGDKQARRDEMVKREQEEKEKQDKPDKEPAGPAHEVRVDATRTPA